MLCEYAQCGVVFPRDRNKRKSLGNKDVAFAPAVYIYVKVEHWFPVCGEKFIVIQVNSAAEFTYEITHDTIELSVFMVFTNNPLR
jgi:hypothetical protein